MSEQDSAQNCRGQFENETPLITFEPVSRPRHDGWTVERQIAFIAASASRAHRLAAFAAFRAPRGRSSPARGAIASRRTRSNSGRSSWIPALPTTPRMQ
jgi:hypothetical protein